jgi:hypothetical protein
MFIQEKKLNHADFSQIKPLSPRVKLPLALELGKKHEKEIDFNKILSPTEDKKEIGEKLPMMICGLEGKNYRCS